MGDRNVGQISEGQLGMGTTSINMYTDVEMIVLQIVSSYIHGRGNGGNISYILTNLVTTCILPNKSPRINPEFC